jgi:hypothetical protein
MKTHADPVATMLRLEEWTGGRKQFKVESVFVGGLSQTTTCTLYCPKMEKKTFAVCYELWDAGVPDRSTEFHPTVVDVIALALDRWDGLVPQYGESDE